MGNEKSLVIAVIGIVVLCVVGAVVLKGVNQSNNSVGGQAARAGSPGGCSITCPDGSSCSCGKDKARAVCTCLGTTEQATCECEMVNIAQYV